MAGSYRLLPDCQSVVSAPIGVSVIVKMNTQDLSDYEVCQILYYSGKISRLRKPEKKVEKDYASKAGSDIIDIMKD